MCFDQYHEEMMYEENARYDYQRELAAELYDYCGEEADMADFPPEQEGVTWERIDYPEKASFVEDRTPPDEDVPF